MADLLLLKLGGSLITEKARPETPRLEVIARLAGEIARASRETHCRLIVGHGSGSFGHVAARESGIATGLRSADQLPGVSRTQGRAAALHRIVIEALVDAARKTVPRISAGDLERAAGAIGAPAGTDVTGGMLHRVETALALARLGIPSLLANGLVPGLVERALRGEEVGGTEVV